MNRMLEKEFKFYLENQSELAKKYNGKILVIKNCEIIGVYDSEQEAIKETMKTQELGTFLVQRCSADNDDYSGIFHSRVAIVS